MNKSEQESDDQHNNFVAEASLSDLLDSPYLSKLILSGLGLVDLCRLRQTNVVANRAVTKLLDESPSMVIIGGLEIELDDEDVEHPAVISPAVYAFRLATMQWYTLPSLPTPRFAAAVCTLPDGQIFVAGGVNELGNNALANPSVFVEYGRSMMGQPSHEAGTRMWRGRNSQRGTKSDAVEMFDGVSGEWRSLPPLPRPRAGARACVDASGGQILVVGGSTDQREFSRDVEVFDLVTNTWLTPTSSRRGSTGQTQSDAAASVPLPVHGHSIPPMNQARTEFAMTRIPKKGILVVGGTNRYLWPNQPLTAELYDFKANRWEALPPPSPDKYEPDIVAQPEQIGCDCALLEDGRHVVVQGGMSISTDYGVPEGFGNESSDDEHVDSSNADDEPRRSEMDCWWMANNAEDDDSDGYIGNERRLTREFDIQVYDLEAKRWLFYDPYNPNANRRAFSGIERARTGSTVWNARGDTVIVAGGNYEFYGESGQYPSHGTTQEVYVVDGPTGKRVLLPWAQSMRRSVVAAGTANLDNIQFLAQKHGWRDLRDYAKVELHGMKNDSYNGRRGTITKDIGGGHNGRWGVTLEGTKKPISVRAECLRLL